MGGGRREIPAFFPFILASKRRKLVMSEDSFLSELPPGDFEDSRDERPEDALRRPWQPEKPFDPLICEPGQHATTEENLLIPPSNSNFSRRREVRTLLIEQAAYFYWASDYSSVLKITAPLLASDRRLLASLEELRKLKEKPENPQISHLLELYRETLNSHSSRDQMLQIIDLNLRSLVRLGKLEDSRQILHYSQYFFSTPLTIDFIILYGKIIESSYKRRLIDEKGEKGENTRKFKEFLEELKTIESLEIVDSIENEAFLLIVQGMTLVSSSPLAVQGWLWVFQGFSLVHQCRQRKSSTFLEENPEFSIAAYYTFQRLSLLLESSEWTYQRNQQILSAWKYEEIKRENEDFLRNSIEWNKIIHKLQPQGNIQQFYQRQQEIEKLTKIEGNQEIPGNQENPPMAAPSTAWTKEFHHLSCHLPSSSRYLGYYRSLLKIPEQISYEIPRSSPEALFFSSWNPFFQDHSSSSSSGGPLDLSAYFIEFFDQYVLIPPYLLISMEKSMGNLIEGKLGEEENQEEKG